MSAARAETAAARQEVDDLRKQYDEQLAGLEERLTQRIKVRDPLCSWGSSRIDLPSHLVSTQDLESRNRLLHTSLGVVKKANRQLKLQSAVATMQRR